MFNLFKVQMLALYSNMFSRSAKKSAWWKRGLISLLAVYVIVALTSSFVFIFHGMAKTLVPVGLAWLFFASVGMTTFGAGVMFTVFSCQTTLFDAKDNELLLSLPVKPSAILGARLMVLATLEYVASLLVLLPAAAVYVWLSNPPTTFYAILAVVMLVLPLLGLSVSCLIGYIISLLTRKNKSLMTVFYVIFIGLYMWGYSTLTGLATLAIENGVTMGDAIRRYLPPFFHMGTALADAAWVPLIWFVSWCAVPFWVMYRLLAQTLVSMATNPGSVKRAVYRETKVKGRSVFGALFAKEWTKFITTPIYLLNCGLGFVFNIVFGVMVVIKGPALLGNILSGALEVTPAMLVVLGFLASMSVTTAPSISLEGKNIWILQSSPITPRDVFHSKLGLNLTLGIPTLLFAGLCSVFVVDVSWSDTAMILVLPVSLQIFSSLMGLIFNLRFPKLNAVNETMMIKQSASVILTMLASIAILLIAGMIYLMCPMPLWAFGVGAFVAITALNLLGYYFLTTWGSEAFLELA